MPENPSVTFFLEDEKEVCIFIESCIAVQLQTVMTFFFIFISAMRPEGGALDLKPTSRTPLAPEFQLPPTRRTVCSS